MDKSVVVEDVSVKFKLEVGKTLSLKEYVIKFFKDQLHYEELWALKNVNFEINKGDVFGIIGKNGAGKSTLLKIIAGILKPTKGRAVVNGNVVPLIELGAGFDHELTGRENIFLNGAMLGYSRRYIEQKYSTILEFAEIGDFINTTVKNYSSGMFMRLAFAIAVTIDPEVLIIDEVLAVGDALFQKKCLNRINEIRKSGATILFVSHSHDQVSELCNKALWLDNGKVKNFGKADNVVDNYVQFLNL